MLATLINLNFQPYVREAFIAKLLKDDVMNFRKLPSFACAALLLLLAACAGVPLRSIPQLLQLQNELLQINPAELIVAIQVDSRLVPPRGAIPLLAIKVEPRNAGAFKIIDKKLTLQMEVSTAPLFGLQVPAAGRRWLIYRMPPDTQIEFTEVQNAIRKYRAMPNNSGSGSLTAGIEQHSLAVTETALANTRWETWLQSRKSNGFFMLWVGTPALLLEEAAKR